MSTLRFILVCALVLPAPPVRAAETSTVERPSFEEGAEIRMYTSAVYLDETGTSTDGGCSAAAEAAFAALLLRARDDSLPALVISAYASGAAVTLIGRNEGGKVIGREAVHAVLESLRGFFGTTSSIAVGRAPARTVYAHFKRVVTMVAQPVHDLIFV